MTVIKATDFHLYEIGKESVKNFKPARWNEISDFQAKGLKWIGDALRGNKSQFFWSDGEYCWYTDETQSHICGVWMTANGIAMYTDYRTHQTFRIGFN